MTTQRDKVAELAMARKATHLRLKRTIATAKDEITPGALFAQFKERKSGQARKLSDSASDFAEDNRDSILFGALAALASGLLAYASRRWKKRRTRRETVVIRREPAPVPGRSVEPPVAQPVESIEPMPTSRILTENDYDR